jgi:prevent-host-death family protein
MRKKKHKTWQLQEAKAKFSKLVDEALESGYQTISRNGKPVAILISKKDFEEYLHSKDNIIDFFMKAPYPEVELDIQRDKDTGREIDL